MRRINVRSTEIETFDRAQVIIPNSSLVTGVVTNLVRNDRTGRVVDPSHASQPPPIQTRVREVLIAIAKANPLVLTIPAPQILFTGMSASALNFELRVFVGDVETSVRVKSDLNFEIFKRFKEEKFFDSPAAPDTKKVEIVNFENFSRLLAPHLDEFLRSEPGKARRARTLISLPVLQRGLPNAHRSLLERRRIEAQFAKAIFDVLAEETGRARAVELLSQSGDPSRHRSRARLSPPKQRQPRDAEPPDLLAYADVLAVWQRIMP